MGKPSIPQIRLGGSQYTIEPTADAEGADSLSL